MFVTMHRVHAANSALEGPSLILPRNGARIIRGRQSKHLVYGKDFSPRSK